MLRDWSTHDNAEDQANETNHNGRTGDNRLCLREHTISNHIYQPGFIGYSTKFFDALEPDIQKALLANVAEDQAFGRKAVRKLGPQLLENLDSFGIKMYTLTAAEKKQFSAKAKEIRKAFEAKSPAPEVRMFLDAIDVGKKAFKKK